MVKGFSSWGDGLDEGGGFFSRVESVEDFIMGLADLLCKHGRAAGAEGQCAMGGCRDKRGS